LRSIDGTGRTGSGTGGNVCGSSRTGASTLIVGSGGATGGAARAAGAGSSGCRSRRSQFSESLPDLMMDLLAPGTKRTTLEEPELPDE